MAYSKGHVRRPDKDHLIDVKGAEQEHIIKHLMAVSPPASWDSRSKGWVGPVKDQSQCGSCWDFSGTGMVEIAYAVAGQPGVVLSEEYTLDCGRNGGCNGDDNITVLEWAQATGLPLSDDYGPYKAAPGTCNYKTGMKLYKIDSWGFADPNSNQQTNVVADTNLIKAAIMTYGSVGAAIAADTAFEDNPAGQVFQGSGSTDINHDIILIGWDDSKGAWLLRNSWGESWCDGGYQWIKYGANLVGTEAAWCKVAGSPTPPPPPPPGPGKVFSLTFRRAIQKGGMVTISPFRAPNPIPAGTYDVIPHTQKHARGAVRKAATVAALPHLNVDWNTVIQTVTWILHTFGPVAAPIIERYINSLPQLTDEQKQMIDLMVEAALGGQAEVSAS